MPLNPPLSPAPSPKARTDGLGVRFIKELRRNYVLYILAAIPFVYLIIFHYVPLYGLQIAFKNYNVSRGIFESPWVGFRYIERFLKTYKFWEIMRNTVTISLYSFAAFPFPILLALLLNYMPSVRFKKTVQLVTYAPHFISVVVIVGMILQFLDARTGPINLIIAALGFEPVRFMMNAKYFYGIFVLSGLWQGIGFGAIIYIASLSGVSTELHEAAIVDGASILKRMWYIDIPCILPTITIMFILRCGSILGVDFEKVFLLQNTMNIDLSEIIGTYVYKQGLAAAQPQYSYSAAIGLFVSVINGVMLLIVNRTAKAVNGNSLW